jgi:lysophospholipase L1-like esterase
MGRCVRVFYGLETFGYAHRKPLPDELPSRRWLAYGSSITNGASPVSHLSSYIYHAARAADLDVLNLGLSGSCFCEREMADFIGSRQDYEIATLEVGVNMRNGVSPEEFKTRVSYLLDAVAAPASNRRVFLVTVYPNLSEAGLAAAQDRFSAVLRELVASDRWSNLGLIEGDKILDDPGDLTADFIHPSDYGLSRLGFHLGQILRIANE